MLIKVIMIVLMFAFIVIVHEWGHYITAKKTGVLVHEFAVGMGPKLWSIKKGETLYSIRALPIGGFCSMEEEVGNTSNPRAMCAKKPWQKLLIVSFGAIMNFVLAWLLLSICMGYMGYGSNVIKNVEVNMPAQKVGLISGDKITAINDIKVKKLADISEVTKDTTNTYRFTIEREGKSFDLNMKAQWIESEQRARFGFSPTTIHYNVIENLKAGFSDTIFIIKEVWYGLFQLITGQVAMEQMAGIVGVVDISAKQWDSGMQAGGISFAIMNMLYIAAFLSANLGVINLLPFPALDGGRIIFIIIEWLRGKPLDPEKESAIHFAGFALLMLLTVVVLYNDILRVFNR